MNRAQLLAWGHEITVDISGITHEKVIGDSLRLQQVFTNLLSNAIKYTPNGGKLSICLTERAANQHSTGVYRAVFRDNGIGMSQEFLGRIFEPFSRESEGENGSGTGLGMPIARNIVRMMGGDIQVESAEGQGTTVTATFTLRLQEEEEADYAAFTHLRVLVTDDDKASCEGACAILDELGMDSQWVLSGQEAVELVQTFHREEKDFFAVILDWKMPGMDGLDTARAIRRTVGEEIPIIVISAYDWSEIEQEARDAGVNAFIAKPLFKSRMVQLFTDLVSPGQGERRPEGNTPLTGLSCLDLSHKTILLVEDNELNAEIATEILEMTKVTVVRAVNGQEALDLVRNNPGGVDLVLMDIQMPVMNGYEATRAIRALGRADTDALPILAMTANAFQEDVQRAEEAGMNGHIAKPLDFHRLEEALRRWLTPHTPS
jgi:CheY-like chemotaxis protein